MNPPVNPSYQASAPPLVASAPPSYDAALQNSVLVAFAPNASPNPASSQTQGYAPAPAPAQMPASVAVPAPAPIQSQAQAQADAKARFDLLVKQHELNQQTADQLLHVLNGCEIVLLCDDSSSMGNSIAEEGTDPFAVKRSTRWLELKKLAASLIEIITATNPEGLDIFFFNRPKLSKVTSMAGLQGAFAQPPQGATPLVGTLRQIYQAKVNSLPNGKQLLLVVITDGEPSDGSRNDLYNVLCDITRRGNVHVSFAECTDNAEDMEYLDAWDGLISNFDNTDDYREELQRVKAAQGAQFKFDYTDYVVKVLLATFVRWYFKLDQTRVADNRVNQGQGIQNLFQPAGAGYNGGGYNGGGYNGGGYNGGGYNGGNYNANPPQSGSACCTIL